MREPGVVKERRPIAAIDRLAAVAAHDQMLKSGPRVGLGAPLG